LLAGLSRREKVVQKAGFKCVMMHETIPGPLNFRQPVNRWLLRCNAAHDARP